VSTRLALVYRGPAARPVACSEAVAALLRSSPAGLEVRYVGPGEEIRLDAAALAGAALYAQPGGGDLPDAYRRMRRHRGLLRDYVARGGRYLGFGLGGYLAGATPGFDLLPGGTGRYAGSPGAGVFGPGGTTVRVDWRGRRRELFFRDGPRFDLAAAGPAAVQVSVLAHYPNGAVAAAVAAFGAGRVGVVGPHPEATPEWYLDAGLAPLRTATVDLGHDLLDEVLR
jgi:glutamine amidotransferase-like uncharacterized protein